MVTLQDTDIVSALQENGERGFHLGVLLGGERAITLQVSHRHIETLLLIESIADVSGDRWLSDNRYMRRIR